MCALSPCTGFEPSPYISGMNGTELALPKEMFVQGRCAYPRTAGGRLEFLTAPRH